jgi:hypothetical protein
MRYIALALLGMAALAAVPGDADARNGCGRGFFYNGYRCVPMGRQYYAPRAYAPEYRVYRRGSNGCPPHYTVQDGVCKPYRGY